MARSQLSAMTPEEQEQIGAMLAAQAAAATREATSPLDALTGSAPAAEPPIGAAPTVADVTGTPAPELAARPETMAPVDGLAQLAKLVAARGGQSGGPGAEEQAYLSANQPQAGWKNVLGAVGAAIAESTGSKGALDAFHRRGAEARKAYEAGLEQARGIDLGKRQVDQGTAEMLVLGGMTPEAAAEVTQGSPSLTLAKSGMGQLGARYKQMDQQAAQKEAALAAKLQQLEDQQRFKQEFEQQQQGNRIELKKTIPGKAPGGGGGGGGGGSPEERAARERSGIASWLAEYASAGGSGPSTAQALAFMEGKTDGIDAATAERMTRGLNQLQSGIVDKKKVISAGLAREAGNIDKPAVAGETKSADPVKMGEARGEILTQQNAIQGALDGFRVLAKNPAALDALVQFGGADEGSLMAAFKTSQATPEEQAAGAKIWRLVNTDIKKFAGSAVTGPEWVRQAAAMGLPTGGWNPFKSSNSLKEYLSNTAKVQNLVRKSQEIVYPKMWEGWK